jgi:hypothetical protein
MSVDINELLNSFAQNEEAKEVPDDELRRMGMSDFEITHFRDAIRHLKGASQLTTQLIPHRKKHAQSDRKTRHKQGRKAGKGTNAVRQRKNRARESETRPESGSEPKANGYST